MPAFHGRAFGRDWHSDIVLSGFDTAPEGGRRDISVERVAALCEREPVRAVNRGTVFADGFRLPWENVATFDVWSGGRIDYVAGDRWADALPVAFYSTVAALTLALDGALPLHACAVAIDGRAILIAGAAGAGKSTLAVELLAVGALLIADDLTMVSADAAGAPVVSLGRPAMRLHPDTAAQVAANQPPVPAADDRGKLLVRPQARAADRAWPIAGIIALGAQPGLQPVTGAVVLAPRLAFRPRWLAALPGRKARASLRLALAAQAPVFGFAPVSGFSGAAKRERRDALLSLIYALPSATAPPANH